MKKYVCQKLLNYLILQKNYLGFSDRVTQNKSQITTTKNVECITLVTTWSAILKKE